MKWRFTPNDWVWSGVALVVLYALQKLFWALLPTGLLNLYSSADGWQLPHVSENLASWRDMANVVWNVPLWLLEYGYFYGIISSLTWLFIAVLLALRKSSRCVSCFCSAPSLSFSALPSRYWHFAREFLSRFHSLGRQPRSMFYWQSSSAGQSFGRSMCGSETPDRVELRPSTTGCS
jgi:hypothetical protein